MAADESSPAAPAAGLGPAQVERLEAGAFRSLCRHLQERSDAVQNIDLMTVGGFCRNCLAKWMVLEARQLVDQAASSDDILRHRVALDAFGYEQAAKHVYGTSYSDWKKRHQTKATDEQLKRYEESAPLHALHDAKLLEPRSSAAFGTGARTVESQKIGAANALMSDVCCQDVDAAAPAPASAAVVATLLPLEGQPPKATREVGPFVPPPLPESLLLRPSPLRVAVLTVSDRASRNEYTTGDLSGPAVVREVQAVLSQPTGSSVPPSIVTAVVPDDAKAIQGQLTAWCNDESSPAMDIVLTTGGTGMSPRDVTPEATRAILSVECPGLMAFVTAECSHRQPLASLSRGTAGIRRKTVIANLPGNPKGVTEVVPLLLPLLLHAVADLNGWS